MLLRTAGLLLQLFGTPVSDSADVLRSARVAQQRFESLRRARLPTDWHGGGSGRCDARIGRYCYWYDSTETKPVAESRAITVARERLIAGLDSAARRSPRDGWIAGQHVRYLLEAGRPDSAVVAARQCESERWWCTALEGLALHVGERYVAADSAFNAALARMPESQRCDWLDIRQLVERRLAQQLSRADCAQRARLGGRLVFLAQPLWIVPGRDWRTEILARRTMALLLARAANPQMSWGDDSRELLMRYGWSEWFTRSEPVGLYSSAVVTGHDREPSYNVFPAVASVRAPRLTPDAWNLRAPLAQSRYSPRTLERLGALRHQLARFRRGDSLVVVVRVATTDTSLQHDSTSAALMAWARDSAWMSPLEGGTGMLVVPSDTIVVSVEVLGQRGRHAERARYTVDPLPRAGRATLSDLLLYSPESGNTDSLASVLPAALPDARVSARVPLGVYWELDGVAKAPAALSLTVEPLRVSAARRLATALHLAPALAPVRLRWQSVAESAQAQHVTVRLPDNARGSYRMALTVQQPGGPVLTTSRVIEVVR